MVRIIPWSLPPVKGGSIGGYTPKVDPTPPTPEPEPKSVYYDFSNANFTGNCNFTCTTTPVTANTPKEIVCKSMYGTFAITGISAVDMVGVASLSLKVESQCEYVGYTFETDNFVMSLDPITYAPTFVSGKSTVTPSSNGDLGGGYVFGESYDVTLLVFTFYVYNGNGEIIQQEDVTVIGGE